jgi:hypothetical protein
MTRFSERRGYQPPEPPIAVREDAPADLRGLVVDYAEEAGASPSSLRTLICGILMTRPNPANWSDYPNVDGEVRDHLDSCPWYSVYDFAEAVHELLVKRAESGHSREEAGPELFERKLNQLFKAKGIGWQFLDGQIQVRGEEAFELAVRAVGDGLAQSGRATAAQEIHQALLDLSARPVADTTGAIQHSMAALECVLRDVANDPKATLGALLAKHRKSFPSPLDQGIEKLWGFASENGRHLREGRSPGLEDAVLTVHVCAAVARYLLATVAVSDQ